MKELNKRKWGEVRHCSVSELTMESDCPGVDVDNVSLRSRQEEKMEDKCVV